MSNYYNGDRLLSSVDLSGARPEIYIVESNRNAGKTTYFAHRLTERILKKSEKIVLLCRWNYEIDNYAPAFFKGVKDIYYPDLDIKQKIVANKYGIIYLNDTEAGYILPINSATYIKRYSHLFTDCTALFYDEIQPEDGQYCPKEIDKFQSIHTSLARGNGQQVRYLPVYCCSNGVSLLNPYYNALGISSRLQPNTKFLRGDGWVMERNLNESAMEANKSSAFNRAFATSCYNAYAAEGVYLNDNTAFISRPEGRSVYMCTIRCEHNTLAVRYYYDMDIVYCDYSVDNSHPVRLSASVNSHTQSFQLIGAASLVRDRLRQYFSAGAFRFKDLACKEAILSALSY